MKRLLPKIVLIATSVAVAGIFVVSPAALAADGGAKSDVCNGIGLTGSNCGDSGAAVSNAITAAINLLSIVVGLIAIIMIVIAGLKFITSSGDTSKVAGAKNTLIYALIGLVIVSLSQVIVHFVLNRLR